LAANATELLTEALFLCGLTLALWLLLRATRTRWLAGVGLAGLLLGALCLLRSVALPLLPLGALWLFINANGKRPPIKKPDTNWLIPVCLFIFTFCLVVLPWTARNYLTYGGLILIDTTGAENLWLDNDPAGREAVKAQLYAMGEDRLARQQLASRQGLAVISADPARFAAKAWGELQKLFALEFSDDMLARRAIWVPPAEVAARLLLGDGIWLVILLAGVFGLARFGTQLPAPGARTPVAWFMLPWALYVGLTTVLFHVELRYRLPLYPALLPFAGLVLAGGRRQAAGGRWQAAGGLLAVTICLGLTLLHANYPALAWRLGWKHVELARAEAALGRGDAAAARQAGAAALALDEESTLARVALARAELLAGQDDRALSQLAAAIKALPAHPYAHLLRGDLLRRRGEGDAARSELAYETSALEDLQAWTWQRFVSPPPSQLTLGAGLDLGFIQGFHSLAPGENGFRWTTGTAQLRLRAPTEASELRLRAASGRPDGSPVEVQVWLDGHALGILEIGAADRWHTLSLPTPISAGQAVKVEIISPTFTPRDYERASADGRRLGVQLAEASLMAAP
ncbi:MAG: hypothetical protein HGA65_13705, partial [Oscillochloris sp.]|nr:hypothetical protein [Oscillochloris sp.]